MTRVRGARLAGISPRRWVGYDLVSRVSGTRREVLGTAVLRRGRVVAIDLEGDQRTRIEAGKLADLIVVRENPLDDIDNVRALAMVFKGGRLVTDHRGGTDSH
jgi:imidazolonepropionase-like amidohydrolase